MVACNSCLEWYHASCMGLSKAEAQSLDVWICPQSWCQNQDKRTPKKGPSGERLCIACMEKPCSSGLSVFCSVECEGVAKEEKKKKAKNKAKGPPKKRQPRKQRAAAKERGRI